MSGLVPDAPRGLVESYGDVPGSARAQLAARPDEARLLAWLMGAMLIVFVSQIPDAMRAARIGETSPGGLIALNFVADIFFAPLFLYGAAAAIRVAALATGARVGWYETRVAFFWAILLAAPLQILTAIPPLIVGPGTLAYAVEALGAAGALWITGACLAPLLGAGRAAAVLALLAGGALLLMYAVAAIVLGPMIVS